MFVLDVCVCVCIVSWGKIKHLFDVVKLEDRPTGNFGITQTSNDFTGLIEGEHRMWWRFDLELNKKKNQIYLI